MSNVTIWTQEGCMHCEAVKAYYASSGYEERDADELLQGKDKDEDALVQLAMQNMQLPLVAVDGAFQDLNALLREINTAAA